MVAYERTIHFRTPASPKQFDFNQVMTKVSVFLNVHKDDVANHYLCKEIVRTLSGEFPFSSNHCSYCQCHLDLFKKKKLLIQSLGYFI